MTSIKDMGLIYPTPMGNEKALSLLAHAEREADAVSNLARGRASRMAYELRKTLAELRVVLRGDADG